LLPEFAVEPLDPVLVPVALPLPMLMVFPLTLELELLLLLLFVTLDEPPVAVAFTTFVIVVRLVGTVETFPNEVDITIGA